MTGVIFDCKRFAVHDGDGLRTTLFLKGCPLRCPWCQNPEGINPLPALWHNPARCIHCGICEAACPNGALTAAERVRVDRSSCVPYGVCAEACPGGAMSITGQTVTAREAADLLLRDKVFFGNGGGVTLSGGETLMQWEFAAEVLSLCKETGVDTAIETCMLAPRGAVEAMLPVVDQFLVDIKYMDRDVHRAVLGTDNRQILDNYRFLVENGANVLTRTPLIPGYTATEDNIRAIARFIRSVQPEGAYELLNFNPLCRSKYTALEQDYPVTGEALSAQEMDRFYGILEQEGITHIIKE